MGLTRKFLSISTLGIIPFRNREERQAAYARQTRNAARASVALEASQLQELRGIRTGVDHGNIARETSYIRDELQAMPFYERELGQGATAPGWYRDPHDPTIRSRWWNGVSWTPDYIDANGQRRRDGDDVSKFVDEVVQQSKAYAAEARVPTTFYSAGTYPDPGWYHHPKDEENVARYWDGGCWTEYRMLIGIDGQSHSIPGDQPRQPGRGTQ